MAGIFGHAKDHSLRIMIPENVNTNQSVSEILSLQYNFYSKFLSLCYVFFDFALNIMDLMSIFATAKIQSSCSDDETNVGSSSTVN